MSNEAPIFQIEIPKRTSNCMHGNETLSPGMEYYSVLQLNDEQRYQRYDYCAVCWENSAKDKFNTFKTSWKAKIAFKNEVEDLSLKSRDEKALFLLKKAIQNSTPEDWAETFVLALYLARRRILYLRKEILQENGTTLCVYEEAATEEMLPILRKSLLDVNIEKIQSGIAKKLQ